MQVSSASCDDFSRSEEIDETLTTSPAGQKHSRLRALENYFFHLSRNFFIADFAAMAPWATCWE